MAKVFIRKRELELEIDFEEDESRIILILDKIPFVRYDEFSDTYRALPCAYPELISALRNSGIEVISDISSDWSLDIDLREPLVELRPYQREAVEWLRKNRFRGVVVLPTGAGKSLIAIYALYLLRMKTLIVVPTIELMHQWKSKIRSVLRIRDDSVCFWGGGYRALCGITITTYQGACKRDFLVRAMDKFGLVVFDEVHHLPAETYLEIAKRLVSPHRIGLTATPERIDRRDRFLPLFVGPIHYGARVSELVRSGYLAEYEYRKISTYMDKEEWRTYRENMRIYREYVRSNFPNLTGRRAFDMVVKMAWKDRRAKEALEARMKAKAIAMAPKSKIAKLNEILTKHRDDKVIIFTRLQRTAHLISYTFGIPVITANVPKSIRRKIFSLFRSGRITKIVSAEALDEGVDVPDASVGIIVSGTSSQRQYIQRVGRVLRPKKKKAIIYELVTAKSFDEFMSKARKGLIGEDS